MRLLQKIFKRNLETPFVVERTNKIQYDCMGYPLRLLKMSDGNYQWLDTYEEEFDVALKPEEVLALNRALKFNK